jgi:hypothetical protein
MSTATESPNATQSPDKALGHRGELPFWRRLLNRRVLFVCIALDVNILAALAYWHGAQAARGAATSLVVAPQSLDFGEVWACKEFVWRLPIHNPTSRDIEVTDMSATCGCATISPKQFVVPPGEMVPVDLTLDLIPRSSRDKAKPLHDFSATIFAVTGDQSRRPLAWDLTGRVREPFTISPPDPDFDDAPLIAGDRFAPRRIRVSLCQDVASVTAEADPNQASVKLERDASKTRDLRLLVQLNEALPVGTHEVRVWLTPVLADETRLAKVPLDLRVNVLNDVEPSPPVVSFGSAVVGSDLSEAVSLCSRTGRPFSVLEASSDDSAVRVAPVAGIGPSMSTYRVSMTVAAVGGYERTIRFMIRQPMRPEPYMVTVRAVGVAAPSRVDKKVK